MLLGRKKVSTAGELGNLGLDRFIWQKRGLCLLFAVFLGEEAPAPAAASEVFWRGCGHPERSHVIPGTAGHWLGASLCGLLSLLSMGSFYCFSVGRFTRDS